MEHRPVIVTRTSKPTADLNAREKYKRDKQDYQKVRRAETQYAIRLRKIANHIGHIVDAFPPGDPRSVPEISRMLRQYADLITPWANAVAKSMLADVKFRDDKVWSSMTKNMGEAMREELARAPTGERMKVLQAEQVRLIRSLPLHAAERVHKLTSEALIDSTRADEIKKEIMRSGKVAESRATLIARTEVGRASTSLAQARAEYVGSDGYIWRTAEDHDVRESHRKMEGKLVKWNRPPTLDGMTGHAGTLPNCRCYPEVVLPDNYLI